MRKDWRHLFPLKALFSDALPIGHNRFRALCPVHLESNPSCIVNYHRVHGWRWHCFACGSDGDALDVLTGRDRMTFREGVEFLERDVGVTAEIGPGMSYAPGRGACEPGIRPDVPLLVCDVCRNETFELRGHSYRMISSLARPRNEQDASRALRCLDPPLGERRNRNATQTDEFGRVQVEGVTAGRDRLTWESSPDLEALCAGWELGQVNACIGPLCLERAAA